MLPVQPTSRPVRLTLLYSEEDASSALQLEKLLSVLRRQGYLDVWSVRNVPAGEDRDTTIANRVEKADVVVLLISPDFMEEGKKWILHAETFGQGRCVLVLLRPVPLHISGFPAIMPRNLLPVLSWADRDEAWLDVVEGIQNVVAAIQQSSGESGARSLEPVSEARPIAVPWHEIFRTNGPPDITFIKPVQFDDIVRELRVMGRGLIVEGPSKIGKSTAVKKALEAWGIAPKEFDGKLMTPADPVHSVVAEFEEIVDALATGQFTGHLLIDDFHYLRESHQRKLALRMKSLADQARPVAKVTIVGINPVGSSLSELVPDLAGRYRILQMGRQPDVKIAELIAAGEAAAGIRFNRRDEIINEADGSFYIAQLFCDRLLAKAEAEHLAGPELDLRPADVIEAIRDDFHGRFYSLLRDFAAHDRRPPPRGAGIALLWLLSRSARGDLSIQEAIYRYPQVEAHFEWLRQSNLLSFFNNHPEAKSLLYYNRAAGTLSIEDPQLKFFLRRLNWADLGAASGHANLQFHSVDGPLFSVAETVSPAQTPATAPQPASQEVAFVLHLSDLHITNETQSTQWYAQLAADLRQQGCQKLAALVVSGDITNQSTPGEYKAARVFLDQVGSGFGLSPRQLVLVPGNHDLNWILSQDAYTPLRRARYGGSLVPGQFIEHGSEIVDVRSEDLYRLRFKHFAEFYREVKGDEYPLDYEEQGILVDIRGPRLTFLGLNSAWEIDHHFRHRAGIHPGALSRALLKLPPQPAGLRIAVFHHPVQNGESDGIRDGGFLEQLAVAGFRVALHGHIHRSDNRLYRYDVSPAGRRLDLVAGGTFGAPVREWVPGYPLQYNLLRIGGDRITVETRRREEVNGAWAPDARWLQGPGQDPLPRYDIEL